MLMPVIQILHASVHGAMHEMGMAFLRLCPYGLRGMAPLRASVRGRTARTY